MFKRILSIAALVFVLGCASVDSPSGLFDSLISRTVLLENENGAGSGVVFSVNGTNYCWTAAHVSKVTNLTAVARHYVSGKADLVCTGSVVRVIASDAKLDLALLELDIDMPAPPPLRFCDDPLSVGYVVFNCGNILGGSLPWFVCQGIVAQSPGVTFDERLPWMDGNFVGVSVAGYPGTSGSGLYLASGEFVGIMVGSAGPYAALAVDNQTMIRFAKENHVEWALQ